MRRGKIGMQTTKNIRALSLSLVAAIVLLASYAFSQNPALQQKIAVLKQSAAQNKQRLMQYQWTETQQITLKGDPKGTKQFLCQYGPNGQVNKTELGGPQAQQQPQGGRLRQRVVEKKKEEMQDYMGDVKGVLSLYVPPDPQKMQQAFQAGNVSFTPTNGAVNIVFKNYAQPNDQMTITFDEAAKAISHIDVKTYTPTPDKVVTLAVQFAKLPDGTNYMQQSVLNAKAKDLVVTTTNSNYQKLGQ
jgi:hypothetical protein